MSAFIPWWMVSRTPHDFLAGHVNAGPPQKLQPYWRCFCNGETNQDTCPQCKQTRPMR